MDIPLDEVLHFDAITSTPSTGAAVDADAAPTFAVYEEATDTDIGIGGNMTKRTSLTGNYRGTFTASAANGFEVGKWYSVIGSAVVGGVTGKAVLKNFRIKLAEAVVGSPKVDVETIKSNPVVNGGTITFPTNATVASTTNITAGTITTVTNLTNLPAITANWLTAAGLAADAVAEIQLAITGGAYDLDTDANGRIRVVDGTGVGEIDTVSGKVNALLAASDVTGNVSAVLADAVAHGGTTATLRLGGTGATAPLTVTNSDGVAVVFQAGGVGAAHALYLLGSGGGDGVRAAGGSGGGDGFHGQAGNAAGKGMHLLSSGGGLAFSIAGATTFTGAVTASDTTNGTLGAILADLEDGGRLDLLIDAILDDTGTSGVVVNAAGLQTDAVQEIRNAITGGAYAFDTDASGRVRVVDGVGAGEIDTSGGAIAHVVLVDTLTTYTGNTPQTGDSFARIGATGSGLTTLATAASVAALNDISPAEVNAEVLDVLNVDTYAEPGQGAPAATASLAAKLNYLYKAWRNKKTQTATTFSLYDDAGTTVDQKSTVSDDATTLTYGEYVTGP